jgi:hypothetical protein
MKIVTRILCLWLIAVGAILGDVERRGGSTGALRYDSVQDIPEPALSTLYANAKLSRVYLESGSIWVGRGTGQLPIQLSLVLSPGQVLGIDPNATNDGEAAGINLDNAVAALGYVKSSNVVDYTSKEITGSSVDFTTGENFFKNVSTSQTITITNSTQALTGGREKQIRIANTSGSSITITFSDPKIVWANASVAASIPAGTSRIWSFKPGAGQLFASEWNGGGTYVADVTAPTLNGNPSINTTGDVLTINWSENTNGGSTSFAGITLAGTTATPTAYIAGDGTATQTFTLNPVAKAGQTITMGYAPASYPWADVIGNKPSTISGQAVNNGSLVNDFLFQQLFNTGSIPTNGGGVTYTNITGSYVNFASTPSIEGPYSMSINSVLASNTQRGIDITAPSVFPDLGTEYWLPLRLQVRYGEGTSGLGDQNAEIISFHNSSGTQMWYVRLTTSGGLQMLGGASGTSATWSPPSNPVDAANPGPIIMIWFKINADGSPAMYAGTSTQPGSPVAALTTSNLAGNGNLERVRISVKRGQSIRVDTIAVSLTNPGTNF